VTACVVVPNHLPHLDFLKEWDELRDVPIIVVQDGPDAEEPTIPAGFNVDLYTWDDIDLELGKNAWIIPRRTSAVRSFGFLKAWQAHERFDTILTLDNDCYPDRLSRGGAWVWSNVPDLDAPSSLQQPDLRLGPEPDTRVVPRWNFFPVCGMNLAWKRDLTPALYFGLFGPDYGFDQYDDIWAGVLVKKIIDHMGYAAITGAPSVDHRKQSDVYANLRKQAPGLEMNENFWLAVQRINLMPGRPLRESYIELVERLPDVIEGEPDGWTRRFKEAALIWAGLFQ
jgi:hypothetical protein